MGVEKNVEEYTKMFASLCTRWPRSWNYISTLYSREYWEGVGIRSEVCRMQLKYEKLYLYIDTVLKLTTSCHFSERVGREKGNRKGEQKSTIIIP